MSNPGIGAGGHGSYGVIYYGKGATGGGYKEPTGPTFDQVAANGAAQDRPAAASRCTPGCSCTCRRCRPPRWAAPAASGPAQGQPINPVGDPYAVYKEIFAGGDFNTAAADPAAVKRLMANKKSILDFVGANLDDFRKRLGTEDRTVDRGPLPGGPRAGDPAAVASATSPAAAAAPARAAPNMIDINDRAQYPNIQKAHMNLMVSALKCGVTNVVTLQHGDSSGNSINFGAFVPGLPALSKNNYKSPWRNWHDLGHSPIQDGVDHKKIVDAWFMARFAELFTQMKADPATRAARCSTTPSWSSATTCRRAPTTTPRRTR